MAHAVLRGSPTPAQQYLERIIQELISESGREEDRHSVSRIVFKCFREHPDRLAFVDGTNDQQATNGDMLRRAVRVARALRAAGLSPGDPVILVGWNHLQHTAAYFGALFAGVTIFCLENILTVYELQYYFNMTKPKMVIVDGFKVGDVRQAVNKAKQDILVVHFGEGLIEGEKSFRDLITGHSDEFIDFEPTALKQDDVAMLFTTGGSSGLGPAKVAPLTYAGLIAQMPTDWTYHNKFPKPTEFCFMSYGSQWLVHTTTYLSAIIFGVKILTISECPNPLHVLLAVKKYKPSWWMTGPLEAAQILRLPEYQHGDLHSLETLALVGFNPCKAFLSEVKKEVNPRTRVCNRFGMTEVHGYVCLGDQSPLPSVGPVLNIFLYKLVNKDGNIVGPGKKGELYLKSQLCVAKTYYGDEEAAKNMITEDGWFRTGDLVVENEQGELTYVDRLKFILHNKEYPISPNELEELVSSVEGVAAVVVCGSEAGPAALVVPRPGMSPSRDAIKELIKSRLNEFKQLTGGVAFTAALPRTHVGKVHRRKCAQLIQQMVADKLCF